MHDWCGEVLDIKVSISLKDIMLIPGKQFDPVKNSGQDVITRIKKLYRLIAQVMDKENGHFT